MNFRGDDEMRRVLILFNKRSGMPRSIESISWKAKALLAESGCEVSVDESLSVDDGQNKAVKAVDHGFDSVIVVGGDGMVNSIGSVLVGTETALGVIPVGSGNGFARHFNIPLKPEIAVRGIKHVCKRRIDVGMVDEKPFFVTCSMAWDAAIVRTFDKLPFRGVLPYVFSAVYEFFEYERQPFHVLLENMEELYFESPVIFTAANLTQYGGGAKIAPGASPDDGYLELIVISQADAPRVLAKFHKLFDGTIDKMEEVLTRQFKKLKVIRSKPAPIQIDGELVEAGREVVIDVHPESLSVLVPEDM